MLWDNEETRVRAVQLHVDYENCIKETLAQFTSKNCKLTKVDEEYSSITTFILTPEEMDTLAGQWTLYRQDQRIAEDNKQARIDSIIFAAREIVAQNTGIKVEEGKGSWIVSVPDASWSLQYPAFDATDFLDKVKMAAKVWQEKELQRQDGFLLLARELTEKIPGIKVTEKEHPYGFHKKKWYVSHTDFTVPFREDVVWALSAEQFYKNVKEIYRIWSDRQDNAEPVAEPVESEGN